jgi:hypothetical protein
MQAILSRGDVPNMAFKARKCMNSTQAVNATLYMNLRHQASLRAFAGWQPACTFGSPHRQQACCPALHLPLAQRARLLAVRSGHVANKCDGWVTAKAGQARNRIFRLEVPIDTIIDFHNSAISLLTRPKQLAEGALLL